MGSWTDLIFVGIAVMVVFAVVATAADRTSVLDADVSQLSHPQLSADQLGPDDLESVRFAVVARGYRMDHVDDVLGRLRTELQQRDERIATLESRSTQPLPRRTPPSE